MIAADSSHYYHAFVKIVKLNVFNLLILFTGALLTQRWPGHDLGSFLVFVLNPAILLIIVYCLLRRLTKVPDEKRRLLTLIILINLASLISLVVIFSTHIYQYEYLSTIFWILYLLSQPIAATYLVDSFRTSTKKHSLDNSS